MKTRSRFVVLFAVLGLVVMVLGLAAIYRAVALDSSRRLPVGAERLLADAAARSLDEGIEPTLRLREASEALLAARSLLAQNRIMVTDPVIGLALQVAIILAVVLFAAALVFVLLARVFTRGIEELRAGVLRTHSDKLWRFPEAGDPEFARVRQALNGLLDLTAEQEMRLAAGARLEGWREVASFLAHQIKNPLAALSLAATNGRLALGERRAEGTPTTLGTPAQPATQAAPATRVAALTPESEAILRDSLAIVGSETARLTALIDRFRDLAPAGLEAYSGGGAVSLLSILEACAARARDAGAAVSIEGPELSVIAERALLEQAFGNLFANSIEAAAGAPVSIRVEVKDEGKRAKVTLRDSNRGLDPAIVDRLGHERLTTKRGGTGLGLILVRRIFALQGGSLDLLLGEGGGLVAEARLPLEGRTA